jgi:hypothetical protein
MRFYTSGNFYPQLPRAIQTLPFDLYRQTKVTRDPSIIQHGIEQYFAGDVPVYYAPQRMQFSKWKSPPTPIGYGQNVISMLDAFSHRLAVERAAQPRGIPFNGPVAAARRMGLDRLPQPTDNMDPNLRAGYIPLARGAVPLNRITDAAVIQTYVDAGNAERVGNDARTAAMRQVQERQAILADMTGGNVGEPWFIRSM